MKPTDKPKKTPPPPPRTRAAVNAGKIPGAVPVRFSAIIANIVGGVLAVMLLTAFFQHHEPNPLNPTETHLNSGYDWLLNSMLENNLKTINENPDKTTQQKYELKWGPGEIAYVDKIKQATPDTAIVLLPPKNIITSVGFKSVVDLPWITYFLYPRRIVYEDDRDKSPLYFRATYLVSINGWGVDKVSYPVANVQPFMVLPIKK